MRLRVSTPTTTLELPGLASVRFLTVDGWRGIWPGHEPGSASVRRGPLRCGLRGVDGDPDGASERVRWLATEGGVILIHRLELRMLTRWVVIADDLARLRALVEARDVERAALEDEARALGQRHELATRRALVALERKVAMP